MFLLTIIQIIKCVYLLAYLLAVFLLLIINTNTLDSVGQFLWAGISRGNVWIPVQECKSQSLRV